MRRTDTTGAAALVALAVMWAGPSVAQNTAAETAEWRPVGNTAIAAGLAGLASGPVTRVWFSPAGDAVFAQTAAGRVFSWRDSETQPTGQWESAESGAPVTVALLAGAGIGEPGARLVDAGAGSPYLVAFSQSVFRSEDGGRTWKNLSRFRGASLIGEGLTDVAVSPTNAEEIVAATGSGVWRSVDGGLSWSGLNAGLPNLPVRRLLSVHPPRLELNGGEAVWMPRGQDAAWGLAQPDVLASEETRRRTIEATLETLAGGSVVLTAEASAGGWIYAASGGRVWISADRGRSWRLSLLPAGSGSAVRLATFEQEPRTALAVVTGAGDARLLRTVNGGLFWDDVTANLAGTGLRAVAGDFSSGTVYAAAAGGLYQTEIDLLRAAPAPRWTAIGQQLPEAAVADVMLDEGGNQLYVALEGYGVWAALAPHRFRDPQVVNAADRMARAAAPGTLLSVLGAMVATARAGTLEAPVLAASGGESQIQVPFEATGSELKLQLGRPAGGALSLALPLRAVAPAIFIDPDGIPMIVDADRGVLLDASTPARAGARIQILATGLGRVSPEWPTGLAAPADSPPSVVAPIRVLVDRIPVKVEKATLAPGYVGFYVVEVVLPDVVNVGPAEIVLEAGGERSSSATLYLIQ
ncbi:MAG: hypothetical protein R2729_16290 [Bryobacteraceae bacterium]